MFKLIRFKTTLFPNSSETNFEAEMRSKHEKQANEWNNSRSTK